MTSSLSRRRALSGAATIGLGAPLLAACGDDSPDAATDPVDASSAPTTSDAPDAGSTTGEAPAAGLVAAADVEVGGGVVLGSEEIVVVQPSDGEFKAFSAVCTHQNCLVGSVSDGVIICPCHQSRFSADDGSVVGGPAPSSLEEISVQVVDGQVVRA